MGLDFVAFALTSYWAFDVLHMVSRLESGSCCCNCACSLNPKTKSVGGQTLSRIPKNCYFWPKSEATRKQTFVGRSSEDTHLTDDDGDDDDDPANPPSPKSFKPAPKPRTPQPPKEQLVEIPQALK